MNHLLTRNESDICRTTGISAQEFLDARASNAAEARAEAARDSRLTQAAKDAPASPSSSRLTPEELAMCERTGITPEQFIAAKTQGA